MRIVHGTGTAQALTAEELADKVRTVLGKPDLGEARIALSNLIDALINERALSLGITAAKH